MLGLTFSSKLDWGSYIISIAKSAFKKTEALVHSWFTDTIFFNEFIVLLKINEVNLSISRNFGYLPLVAAPFIKKMKQSSYKAEQGVLCLMK